MACGGLHNVALQRTHYSKTLGRATMKGEWFEVKTAALLYLRGINSKQEFMLGSNVEQARNFDDIVLKYKTPDDENEWHTCFMQLKHKERALLNASMLISADKGGFSLKKYLKSYSDIKRKMLNAEDEVIFNGSFEKCDFVIYTNANLDSDLGNRHRTAIVGPVNHLLGSELDREMIVTFSEDIDRDIFSAMASSGPDAREFLKKLKVFTGQPSESEMNDLIKEELKISCSENKSDVDVIYRFFIEAVEQWWGRDQVVFLNEHSDLLEKSMNQYKVFTLSASQKVIYRLRTKFQDFCLERMKNEIRRTGPLFCVVSTPLTLKLSCTKVLQLLREEKDAYIFVNLDCFLNEKSAVISGWMDGKKRFLVIVSESSTENAESCDEICVALQAQRTKRLVLVHRVDDPFADCLKRKLGKKYEVFQDSFEVSQLDKSSNDSIVKRKVIFQGYPVLLKLIFNNRVPLAQKVIANNLSAIINSEVLHIGTQAAKRLGNASTYELKQFNVIKQDILTTSLPPSVGLVAVSGMAPSHMYHLLSEAKEQKDTKKLCTECQFLTSASSSLEEEFNQKSKAVTNAHWLKMTEDRLEWIRSKGVMSHIGKFIDNNEYSKCFPTTAFDATDERIVLIAAERGSGKSTMLADIAYHTKKAHPATWVLLVKLGDNVHLLRQDGDVNATVFLMAAAGIDAKSPLERDLFRFCVEQSGNVVVLLDGLNDMDSVLIEKVCCLLMSLLQTKVSKVWVILDASSITIFENAFSTIAYSYVAREESSNDNSKM